MDKLTNNNQVPAPNIDLNDKSISIPNPDITIDKKSFNLINFIKSAFLEIFLILLFTFSMLITLNYFNLIPLPNIFPTLSFLPRQEQSNSVNIKPSLNDISFFNNNFTNLASCNPPSDKYLIINSLINCNNPKQINNTKNKYQSFPISTTGNPGLLSNNGTQINISFKINTNGEANDIGLMFGGGPKDNRFYLDYSPGQKAWGAVLLFGFNASNFEPIYLSDTQRISLSLQVSNDGKTITVLLPNGVIKTFNTGSNFYTKDGSFPVSAWLPPNSDIIIYNLNYYQDE